MALNLFDLVYKITPEEYLKIILSSGDYFPGFYRFTMGNRTYEYKQMTVKGLVKYYLDQLLNKKLRSRNDWFNKALEKLDNLDQRLRSRSDYAVYQLLDREYRNWISAGKEYDIAIIETQNKSSFNKDKTYFFMGAMIRFTDNEIFLGYDDYRNVAVEKISVDFDKAQSIINEIYPNNFTDLFIPATVIGSIIFDNDDDGILNIKEDHLNYLFTLDSSSVVIASNRSKSQKLSMRWAKDIILTEYD